MDTAEKTLLTGVIDTAELWLSIEWYRWVMTMPIHDSAVFMVSWTVNF